MGALVIGAGPAAWSVAAALRRRQLPTTLVAPEPEAPFRNGYGLWADELEALALGDVFERTWPRARVHFDEGRSRSVERVYARIDNAKLKASLRARADGLETVSGTVERVVPNGEGFVVEGPGLKLDAEVVIDASGHESGLVRHDPGPDPGWQVALGWKLRALGHGYRTDEAVLMDFRRADLDDHETAEWPSFVYVMPEDEDVVFVEETSLVARPPVALEQLEARLRTRLRRRGLVQWEVLDVERCFIPMGGPPAPPVQPVVAFGGAARLVHPATGYTLARILRTAPRLAAAVERVLSDGLTGPARDEALWTSVWTRGERASHDLQRFGMEVLLGMDTAATSEFFATFFELPETGWRRYMAGGSSPAEVRSAMLGVFGRASWRLRWRLAAAGLGPSGGLMRQAVFVRG